MTRWTRSIAELAEKVDGGYRYECEGRGYGHCDGEVIRTRRWTTVGTKQGGWLVLYAANDDGTDDISVVLVLCPIHAKAQREVTP